jgi:hypothetical protein
MKKRCDSTLALARVSTERKDNAQLRGIRGNYMVHVFSRRSAAAEACGND